MEKTRKTISVLHLTENIPKPEKNSLCCISPKPYRNLKFEKIILSFQKQGKQSLYCI